MWLPRLLGFFAIIATVCASPVHPQNTANSRLLFESTEGIFFENVVTRSNGHLLLTTFNEGRIYSFDPLSSNQEPRIVAQIPGTNGSLGISEISPDVFAINGGIFVESDLRIIEGTARVTTLDLTRGKPAITTVARVANTTMLNGMASLPFSPHVVLCADSKQGRVFRINTLTGSVDVIFQHPMLTGTPELQMGINGIKILDDYLYFTSSGRGLYGRFPIDAQGNIIGGLEELAWLPAGWALGYDDFALSKEGVAYVATQTNELIKITADGNQTILLDENTELVPNSPTAATLSRDEQRLYLVTSGSSSVDPSKAGQIIELRL